MKKATPGLAILTAACGIGTNAPAIGTPNPASAHCVTLGGKVEIRKEAGGEVGYCHLPDGRVVEEWALFRAQTPKT
ncbi:DUF333 domain-containing protein [Paracoccus sp. CPCC 101403]|uniref:DUF333 domain-containing protein n=2 Tax=Paracoccus broussonetiae TaxID=3075834 RepID=A0ABU3EHE7_9RHOB|nr:DUF333 domain-containing protein [Paracoccus sp. CPCC 101403]MDT1063660.1 DUF333 domain-containing protein [Paracoccus sp. CPCC 101403]